MDKYYLRLLDSVSNSRGIYSSIQRTPSSLVSSYSTVSYSRPTEFSTSVEGSRYSFGKEGSGGSSCIIDRSRILSSSLHCSEEDGGNETSHRRVHSQLTWLFPTSQWRPTVLSELRFFQVCGPLPWIFQTFISIFLFAIHTADTFGLFGTTEYQFRALPFGLWTAPLVFTKVMQAAIAHLHTQAIQIHSYMDDSQHRCSHHTVSLSGVSHLMEKVRPDSFSGLHLCRRTFPYSTGLSSSSTGKVSESLFESSSVSVSENSYCSPIFTTARSFKFFSGRCSTWSPSHSTTSCLSTPTLAPSFS